MSQVKNRLDELCMESEKHTVVFDRGNNSKDNLKIIKDLKLHYVGALTPYHHKGLISKAFENLSELEIDNNKIQVYRDKRNIWTEERTVVVFISEKLKSGQIRGVHQSFEKIDKQLQTLQKSLSNPKAKKRNKKELAGKTESIIKKQYVKDLIKWTLEETSKGKFRLDFTINQEELNEIERKLGLRILMTDHHEWSTTSIIKAYYGQSMIEHAFKNLKNPYHLALRPQFHWTDQKIKVHFFICVIGYLLSTLAWRETKRKAQFKGSLDALLDSLNNVRLATILEDSKTCGRVKTSYKLEETSEEENLIIKALGIEDAHKKRIKFRGVGVYN